MSYKTLYNLGLKGNFLYLTKSLRGKTTANVTFSCETLNSFSLEQAATSHPPSFYKNLSICTIPLSMDCYLIQS